MDMYVIETVGLPRNFCEELPHTVNSPLMQISDMRFSQSSCFFVVAATDDESE
jgi:hypothetical protein